MAQNVSATPPFKAPPGPGTEFEVRARGSGPPVAATASDSDSYTSRLNKFNEMRNATHATRWKRSKTDGMEEQTEGMEEGHKRRDEQRQDDRRQRWEEQTDGIEEFQKLVEEENRKKGRHRDIRQGDFGPSDDERYVFPFVQLYKERMWGPTTLMIPIDPKTNTHFDDERAANFAAWQAKLKK